MWSDPNYSVVCYVVQATSRIAFVSLTQVLLRLDVLLIDSRVTLCFVMCPCCCYGPARASASNIRYLSILVAAFWGHIDATQ